MTVACSGEQIPFFKLGAPETLTALLAHSLSTKETPMKFNANSFARDIILILDSQKFAEDAVNFYRRPWTPENSRSEIQQLLIRFVQLAGRVEKSSKERPWLEFS